MAIDSAEKRRAVANIWWTYAGVGVTPNASKDVEWRQESGRGYPGITPAGAVEAGVTDFMPLYRPRRRG